MPTITEPTIEDEVLSTVEALRRALRLTYADIDGRLYVPQPFGEGQAKVVHINTQGVTCGV